MKGNIELHVGLGLIELKGDCSASVKVCAVLSGILVN